MLCFCAQATPPETRFQGGSPDHRPLTSTSRNHAGYDVNTQAGPVCGKAAFKYLNNLHKN